jgi:hypothetical protein
MDGLPKESRNTSAMHKRRQSRENPTPHAYSEERREEQHTAGGKETGETAHVERWNNTLRQRLTFSNLYTFSKEKRVIPEGLLPGCLHFTT